MDLHHLRIFVSVFKHRSFSKASAEVNLRQPTVSEHIRVLEEELNCKLFDRLGRTIHPTKEAELLYQYALEILEQTETLKERVLNYRQEIAGDLVIGASSIPGTYLLPSLIVVFNKKYPRVTFQVAISDSQDVLDKLLRQELLLGMVGSKYHHDQLDFLPFMEDELIAVAALAVVKSRNFTIKQLIDLPMVVREKGSGTRREFERIMEKEGISLDKIKEAGVFGSTEAVKQAVKAGLGFSILSKLSVREELVSKSLAQIKIKNLTMKRSFYAVTHKKRTLPPVYQLFWKQLVK